MRPLFIILLISFCYINGCGDDNYADYAEAVVEDRGYDEGCENWHQRYVEDHCARCPECCVTTLWDSTEAELDLPDGDEEHCSDCPGNNCICVQDDYGLWWIDATVGDTEHEEDFGRYDDSQWPDQWTPPDDEEYHVE